MRHMRLTRFVPILAGLVTLASCINDQRETAITTPLSLPSMTHVPESTELPTITSTFTPRPTRTPRSTFTPLPPTPLFPQQAVDQLLFDNAPSYGCQLPCWGGLTVGQSKRQDVYRVLESNFGFATGDVPFTSFCVDTDCYLRHTQAELDYGGHTWLPSNESRGHGFLELRFGIDKNTDILAHLSVRWGNTDNFSEQSPSLKQIMLKLGEPSYILVHVEGTEVGNVAGFEVITLYEYEGKRLSVIQRGLAPVEVMVDSGDNKDIVLICLDTPILQGEMDIVEHSLIDEDSPIGGNNLEYWLGEAGFLHADEAIGQQELSSVIPENCLAFDLRQF